MNNPSHTLPQNVRDAIERGNLVDAIKLLRQQTGLGLKEAKDLVDSQVGGNVAGAARSWSGTLPASAAAALQQGNKLDAIRLLREETGLDLKEAKAFIDAHSQRILPDRKLLSPGEVPRSGTALLWLAASAVVIAIVVYLVFQRAT
jgi:ribosomal protein L7/L12